MELDFHVRHASWGKDREAVKRIRSQVFVKEQRVPPELEWDGLDDGADQFLAEDRQGHAIGTARLLPTGQIGRMAVLPEWRNRGIGRALLHLALDTARDQGVKSVFLNAQTQVLGFYEAAGFESVGGVFKEADIPHIRMELGF